MSTKEITPEVNEQKPEKKAAPKTRKKKAAEPKQEAKSLQLRGLVADCNRLNVRSLATMTSGVVAILNRGDSVLVDPDKSTDGWYSIKTRNGKTGFCMKKYIKTL